MDALKPTFWLIARWRHGRNPHGIPDLVRWDDGSKATLDEYWEHENDTQVCIRGPKGGVELHFYPEIIADVRFNQAVDSWVIDGAGATSSALEETDPEASDDVILAALCKLPVFYRARINRGPCSANNPTAEPHHPDFGP